VEGAEPERGAAGQPADREDSLRRKPVDVGLVPNGEDPEGGECVRDGILVEEWTDVLRVRDTGGANADANAPSAKRLACGVESSGDLLPA